MPALPRYRRAPLRAVGASTERIRSVRQLAYRAVSLRCRGRCETCGHAWEAQSGFALDPHHAFGRTHVAGIPARHCESPELVLGICRPCHERIHLGDQKLADEARWLALERFCARWELDLLGLLAEAGPDAVDVMRAAC